MDIRASSEGTTLIDDLEIGASGSALAPCAMARMDIRTSSEGATFICGLMIANQQIKAARIFLPETSV